MIQNNKTSKFLNYAILLISVSSVLQWCELLIGNTFLWWLLDGLILIKFFVLTRGQERITPIFVFLLCVGVSFVYGVTWQAYTYWDWKLLVSNLMVFSLPLTVYVFLTPSILGSVLHFWLGRAWIILLILAPFLASDAFGRFLMPYSFLALFFTVLNTRNRIIIAIAYGITITLGNESRSDMLKFSVCLLLGFVYYIPIIRSIFKRWMKEIVYVLWVLPIVMLGLGVTGVFNVFNIEEELGLEGTYMIKSSNSGEDVSALTDTRTFLYSEEITSAIKNNYVIQGRSMARGYDSLFFGDNDESKRGERGKCETSILNIFNYFGLIGVIIYFGIFVTASYKAIAHSKNVYVSIIGVYVAFRWLFGWIEDFSNFDLNYLFLWIMISICYSDEYRNMTNQEFIGWIRQTTKI